MEAVVTAGSPGQQPAAGGSGRTTERVTVGATDTEAEDPLAAGSDQSNANTVEARPSPAHSGARTALTSPVDGEWDVFTSFRHAEAKSEAMRIKAALEERGISCFVSDFFQELFSGTPAAAHAKPLGAAEFASSRMMLRT